MGEVAGLVERVREAAKRIEAQCDAAEQSGIDGKLRRWPKAVKWDILYALERAEDDALGAAGRLAEIVSEYQHYTPSRK